MPPRYRILKNGLYYRILLDVLSTTDYQVEIALFNAAPGTSIHVQPLVFANQPSTGNPCYMMLGIITMSFGDDGVALCRWTNSRPDFMPVEATILLP